MKHSCTAFLAAAAALAAAGAPAVAQAGPEYSAEEIIEHFSRTQPAGDTAGATATGAARTGGQATRGVFIGAAGFGNEAGATAAASQAASGETASGETASGQGALGQADASVLGGAATAASQADMAAPLAIPMTGASAGQDKNPGAGTAEVVAAGKPAGESPAASQDAGGYDLLITFELDSATLTPQARENLDAFVTALRSRSLLPYRFSVEGHTDATGPDGYNQALSERRAASVVDYLVQHGVGADRLVARGYGETRPRRADPTAAANRRVETRRIE